MGWSYRKRLRFGLFNVNLSRNGIGTSWGVPGFRITRSSTGGRYVTISLPGTGLSWRKTLGGARRASRRPAIPTGTSLQPARTSLSPLAYLYVQSVRLSSRSLAGGTTGPLVNGVPWWQQVGMKKGPPAGP